MRFDENGVLRGINPETGFFGVCPGTNITNPNATLDCLNITIFSNVTTMSDGVFFWEGMEEKVSREVYKPFKR